jgi:UPF0716 protein FxsA
MTHPTSGRVPGRTRRSPWGLVFVAFLVIPIIEIYVLIQVGQVIGGWWTVLLLVADSIFGSWLLKREGVRAWRALQTALSDGRMPARELADAALIVFGGTLMITPGFVTDVFGLVAILPFTRPFARRLLTAFVARRIVVVRDARRPEPPGDVVRGEVVDP